MMEVLREWVAQGALLVMGIAIGVLAMLVFFWIDSAKTGAPK